MAFFVPLKVNFYLILRKMCGFMKRLMDVCYDNHVSFQHNKTSQIHVYSCLLL